MGFQPATTVKKALDAIHKHEFVLPAIQREFAWNQSQICRLFDSLMRGYPLGSFLLWKVEKTNVGKFGFYDFVLNYHEKNAPHCPALQVPDDASVCAVLDGQQRLTALNIGLRGSHAIKEPKKWESNPNAFIAKRLHLNLLAPAAENEQGMEFDLRFLSEERAAFRDDHHCWFPVHKIMQMKAGPPMHAFLVTAGLGNDNDAYTRLQRLYDGVHTDLVIHAYLEENQDLDHVLDIFIRVNSGGTVLSFSDLLLSIATAEWDSIDARARVHSLVDELNQTGRGFSFSKDFVLKAGLMLTDTASVGFKVTNFNKANMLVLQEKWADVEKALRLAAQFGATCGFSRDNLVADSPFLLVAYYLNRRKADASYLTSQTSKADRSLLQSWMLRSLLKPGVWGSGLDTTLTALRLIIKEHGGEGWPSVEIEQEMAKRGRPLRFEAEEVEEMADMEYGDRRAFALLSLTYPFVDFRNVFHVDHIFPKDRFRKSALVKAGVPEEMRDEYREKCNRLANLQLLDGPFNQAKSDAMPADWLRAHYPDPAVRAAHVERHDLRELPEQLTDFGTFYEERRKALVWRLRQLLGVAG